MVVIAAYPLHFLLCTLGTRYTRSEPAPCCSKLLTLTRGEVPPSSQENCSVGFSGYSDKAFSWGPKNDSFQKFTKIISTRNEEERIHDNNKKQRARDHCVLSGLSVGPQRVRVLRVLRQVRF